MKAIRLILVGVSLAYIVWAIGVQPFPRGDVILEAPTPAPLASAPAVSPSPAETHVATPTPTPTGLECNADGACIVPPTEAVNPDLAP